MYLLFFRRTPIQGVGRKLCNCKIFTEIFFKRRLIPNTRNRRNDTAVLETCRRLRIVRVGFYLGVGNRFPKGLRNRLPLIVCEVASDLRFAERVVKRNFVAQAFAEIERRAVPTVVERHCELFAVLAFRVGSGTFCQNTVKSLYILFGKYRFVIIEEEGVIRIRHCIRTFFALYGNRSRIYRVCAVIRLHRVQTAAADTRKRVAVDKTVDLVAGEREYVGCVGNVVKYLRSRVVFALDTKEEFVGFVGISLFIIFRYLFCKFVVSFGAPNGEFDGFATITAARRAVIAGGRVTTASRRRKRHAKTHCKTKEFLHFHYYLPHKSVLSADGIRPQNDTFHFLLITL